MHRRNRWRRVFAMAMAMALVAGACGDDDDDDAGSGPGTPTDDVILITATDYELDVPDEIEASTIDVRFTNAGEFAHDALWIKIGDTDPEDVFTALEELEATEFSGPIPDIMFDGTTQLPDLQPGEADFETEMSMSSGTWLVFCSLTDDDTEGQGGAGGGDTEGTQGRAQEEEPTEEDDEGEASESHFRKGMYKVVTVTGDDQPDVPEGDTVVTIRDYTFDVETLEAGEQTLVAVNDGPDQLHHVLAFDMGPDVDAEEAEDQFRQLISGGPGGGEGGGETEGTQGRAQEEEEPGEGPPGGEPEEAFHSGILSPGYGQTIRATIQSGHTYVLVCFIHDREGGAPHAIAHDMFKAVTAS